MTGRIFVDSNIWIYLFAEDDNEKSRISRKFILEKANDNHLIISFQVINEVCRILKKKKFTEEKLRFVINYLTKICEIHKSTVELSLKASELRENYNFSFWDSHIVAHAIDAQSDFLASEDMQNDSRIHGMIIKNIFDS
jgi:predicted nucleic acid-binding protein